MARKAFGLHLELAIFGAGLAQEFDLKGIFPTQEVFLKKDTPMIINGHNHAFGKK